MRAAMLVFLAVVCSFQASAVPPKLVFVANSHFPPLSYSENGVAKGLWVELSNAVAQRLGVPYSVGVDQWAKAQSDLQAGKCDVLCSMSFTKERASQFELTLPVSQRVFTFFSLGMSQMEAIGDLRDSRVGVIDGSLPLQQLEGRKGVSLTTFVTYEEAFTALKDGKIDVFAADRWVGTYVLSRGEWQGVSTSLSNFASVDVGFAVRKGNTALRDKLNEVIVDFKKAGTFDEITKRWALNSVIYVTSQQLLLVVSGSLFVLLVLSVIWISTLLRRTNQKRKAEAFSQKLSFALDQANWGVAITNEAGTQPIYMNHEFARMHGYEIEELVGRPWAHLTDPEDLPTAIDGIRQTFELGCNKGELGQVRKDGSKFPSWYVSTALRSGEGKIEGLVINLLDITERKAIESERLRYQKLEIVGSLAAGIAHDFNNILAALRGQIELASIHLRSKALEKAEERLGKTPALFDRAKVIASRLVTFAKGGTPVRSLVSLQTFLKDWVELTMVGSDLVSTVGVAPDLDKCSCDPDQIGQVVHNLVLNARQACGSGGKIAVLAFNRKIDRNYVVISVADQGCGIPKETLDRVFEPFFTTKQSGSGMGLPVCYSIIRQHSGWIEVASEVGKGSTFTIFLPSSAGNAESAQEPSSCTETQITGLALVMDDEEGIRDSVGAMLQLLGLEVLLVGDGQEALRMRSELLCRGKSVALYVLDLTIPGRMGGLETAEHLKREGDTGLVLFISGYSDDVLRLTAGQFPGAGWLPKPFTNTDLCTALSRLEGVKTHGR